MAQVKTRAKSTSHLSNLVGTGRELLVSELPTVRDILRYGIYLRDQSKDDRGNYPVDQLLGDIFPGLIGQWSKANALFKPPVINEKVTIMSKLKEVWNQAVKFSLGKGKLDAKERFNVKILHTSRDRKRRLEEKDPTKWGPLICRSTRDRWGHWKGRGWKTWLRKGGPSASTKVQKNYDDIPNIALASVRYGIGLRPTAAIATASLIDAGIITEDNTSKVIDKNKVKRAQKNLMRELGEEFEEKCREMGGISCILFDGRIDLTNVMMEAEGSDQSFPAKIKEEHYYPCWFNVKVKHSWIEGLGHILFQLDCLKSQRKEVLDLVMPTVRRSAWYAHSEAILQTLLCSEDQKEIIEGVERFLAIRGEGDPDTQLGDSSVSTRRTPDINCDASSIGDLISWCQSHLSPAC
ncbi:ADP-ribosylation factor 1 [Dissostichus eleginoides]|uniref:ADP-ribosylation factor 1 n=1 Tax=Dissostichus eleginoides TaxID=100907 RepID=A0AAD9F680_DISEL|nr:ADP-ribosylation factor 1 [Dissostichus eleginoides]